MIEASVCLKLLLITRKIKARIAWSVADVKIYVESWRRFQQGKRKELKGIKLLCLMRYGEKEKLFLFCSFFVLPFYPLFVPFLLPFHFLFVSFICISIKYSKQIILYLYIYTVLLHKHSYFIIYSLYTAYPHSYPQVTFSPFENDLYGQKYTLSDRIQN